MGICYISISFRSDFYFKSQKSELRFLKLVIFDFSGDMRSFKQQKSEEIIIILRFRLQTKILMVINQDEV